jgi:hypothetical protein
MLVRAVDEILGMNKSITAIVVDGVALVLAGVALTRRHSHGDVHQTPRRLPASHKRTIPRQNEEQKDCSISSRGSLSSSAGFAAWKLLSILVIDDDTAPDPGSSTN